MSEKTTRHRRSAFVAGGKIDRHGIVTITAAAPRLDVKVFHQFLETLTKTGVARNDVAIPHGHSKTPFGADKHGRFFGPRQRRIHEVRWSIM